MLGHPEAVESPFFGPLSQLNGAAQGVGGALRFMDGALVEDAQLQVQGYLTAWPGSGPD